MIALGLSPYQRAEIKDIIADFVQRDVFWDRTIIPQGAEALLA